MYTSGFGNPFSGGFDQAMNQYPGAMNMGASWMQNPGMGYYPGQTYAGFTPYQQQSWDAGLNAAGNVSGMGQGMMNQFYGSGPNSNLQNAINAVGNDMQTFHQRNTLPNLGHDATAAGQFGSSRHGVAQGIAESDLNRNFGNISARMRNDWMGQQLRSAPGMMGAYGQSQMAPFQMLQGIGGQQQQMDQNAINNAMAQFNYYNNLPQNRLMAYSQFLGGLPLGGTNSSQQGAGLGYNILGSAAQGFFGGFGGGTG